MGSCAYPKRKDQSQDRSLSVEKIYQISDFRLVRVIGKGGFSEVWMAQHKVTGKPYALKVMSKASLIAKKCVRDALTERRILTRLMETEVKGIAQMIASFQDKQNLYILLHYLPGHSLRHHLNHGLKFTQQQIKLTVYAILKILQELQSIGVLHRDIKPENILLDTFGRPFLTDFGIAEIVSEEGAENDSGTVGYMAPEVMLGQTHSFTADYYAVGVIAFQLLFGRRPFIAPSKKEMLREVSRTIVNAQHFPELKGVSAEASDFISRLLQRKPRLRLGHGRGIAELLQHPWFGCLRTDTVDTLQLQYIKSPLISPLIAFSTAKHSSQSSVPSGLGKEIISKLLHREHIQEMFSSFDSQFNIPSQQRLRKLSEGVQIDSMSDSVKQSRNHSH